MLGKDVDVDVVYLIKKTLMLMLQGWQDVEVGVVCIGKMAMLCASTTCCTTCQDAVVDVVWVGKTFTSMLVVLQDADVVCMGKTVTLSDCTIHWGYILSQNVEFDL